MKVRVAQIRGMCIPKGCRKIRTMTYIGIGLTDAEALKDLHDKINKAIGDFKLYEFNEQIDLYDGGKSETCLCVPIFPNVPENNYNTISWEQFTTEQRRSA